MSISDSDFEIDDISEISEQEYMDEINAFERVGGVTAGKLTQAEKIMMNPLEKFRYNLKNTIYGLNKLNESKLFDDAIISYLEEMAINVDNIGRKNVLAYILGFYIIKNKKINQTRFQDVIKNILPELDNENVKPPDLIRYGRLWENMLM
jgi:hypothetical protein|tara:strand:+ start:316 stop:765 length:450 start_codon:yes stop_codon:yes gene_type:complete